MNKVFFNIGLYFAFLFLHIASAQAYEFKGINALFSAIKTDYANPIDIKNICLDSSNLIQQFDPSFKIYYSSSKAFLYKNNELVYTFTLPQNKNIAEWQHFIIKFLKTSIDKSPKLSYNAELIENSVIQYTLQQLDKYSRLENNISKPYHVDYKIQDDVLYIRCDTFENGISGVLKNIILQYPSTKGLILDLRQNHGGDFGEAIKTADLFLDNVLIAYSIEQNFPKRFYNASQGDILYGKPIAILTGKNTASAAEIVVAALSEQNRATLIGTKTFGKGTIQSVRSISKQKLYLTNGYFFSPSGKVIDNVGIVPDIDTTASIFSNEITIALDYIKQRIS